jgi:hypothetical protein
MVQEFVLAREADMPRLVETAYVIYRRLVTVNNCLGWAGPRMPREGGCERNHLWRLTRGGVSKEFRGTNQGVVQRAYYSAVGLYVEGERTDLAGRWRDHCRWVSPFLLLGEDVLGRSCDSDAQATRWPLCGRNSPFLSSCFQEHIQHERLVLLYRTCDPFSL